MPVFIQSVDFFSELQGVSDEPVDWLLANVGDKITIETTFKVLTYAAASVDSPMKLNAKDGGFIGSNWVFDPNGGFADFRVGDTVVWGNYVTGAYFQTLTIAEKKDETAVRFNEALSNPPASGSADEDTFQSIFSVATAITACRYKYNFIENDEAANFFSKISGTEHLLLAREIDANDTTPVNMEFIGEKSYQVGSAEIEGVSLDDGTTSGIYSSTFKIRHETVLTPVFLSEQMQDILNSTAPDYYFNTKCLKAIFDIEAMYEANDPNRIQTVEVTEVKGNTGWFNENFNTAKTNYEIESLQIRKEDGFGDLTNKIILSSTVKTWISFQITNSIDNPFTPSFTKFILNFIKLPETESEYKLNNRTFEDNFIFDRIVIDINDTGVNGEQYGTSRQVFEDWQVTDGGSSVVSFTGLINMSSDAVSVLTESETPRYAIYVSTQDHTREMKDADKVSLLLQASDFFIDNSDPDMVEIETCIKRHPETDACGCEPEIEIQAVATFGANDIFTTGGNYDMSLDIQMSSNNPTSVTYSVTGVSGYSTSFEQLRDLINDETDITGLTATWENNLLKIFAPIGQGEIPNNDWTVEIVDDGGDLNVINSNHFFIGGKFGNPKNEYRAKIYFPETIFSGQTNPFNLILTLGGSPITPTTFVVTGQSNISNALAAMESYINADDRGFNAYYVNGKFVMLAPDEYGEDANGWSIVISTTSGSVFINTHYFSAGINGLEFQDYAIFPNDDMCAISTFYIDKNGREDDSIVIRSVESRIKAKNSSTLSEFVLDGFSYDMTNAQVLNENQYIDYKVKRSFKIPVDEIRGEIKIKRRLDLDNSDLFYYEIYFPFLMRWEYWRKLAQANDAFFDLNEPNNGWNNFWHRYTTQSNWGLYNEVIVRCTKNGIPQTYTHEKQINSTTFLSSTDWQNVEIKSYNTDLFELNDGSKKYILNDSDTIIEASFESTFGTPDIDICTVVFWLEVFEQGGIETTYRYSSRWATDGNTCFKSSDGKIDLVLDNDTVIATATIDKNKLPNGSKYSITARIFYFEPDNC